MAGIQNSLTGMITTLGAGIWAGKGLKQRELQELAGLRTEVPQMKSEVTAAEEGVKKAELVGEAMEKGYRPESEGLSVDVAGKSYTGTKYLDPMGVDKPTIEGNIEKAKQGLLTAQGVLEGKQAQLRLFEARKAELSKKWGVK